MTVSGKTWAATVGWALLVLMASRHEATGALPAMCILALAPLALAILVAAAPMSGRVPALEAEALAWEQLEAERASPGSDDGRLVPVREPRDRRRRSPSLAQAPQGGMLPGRA